MDVESSLPCETASELHDAIHTPHIEFSIWNRNPETSRKNVLWSNSRPHEG